MQYTRLYTGPDNQSHFEDKLVPLSDAEIGQITNPIAAESLYIGEVEAEYETSWHNAPRRQYVILLEGAIEIELGDGSKRVFKTGDILLAEDLTGKGHITRSVSPGKRKYIFVHIKS
jgi:quercetin dioxygenase-like cupin family protein